MLSDSCLEVIATIDTRGLAAIEEFSNDVEHYSVSPFDYPSDLMETLRTLILKLKTDRLSVAWFKKSIRNYVATAQSFLAVKITRLGCHLSGSLG